MCSPKADNAPIEVRQISLVSHSSRLVQLESSSGAALAVRRADSLAVSLKAQRAAGGNEEEKDADGRVHFSSVSCSGKGEGQMDVQQPPHLDFLKPGFLFDNSLAGRKKPPRLKEDLIVVFWKSPASSALGVLVTPLRGPSSAQVTSVSRCQNLIPSFPCARVEGVGVQSKERKISNFVAWRSHSPSRLKGQTHSQFKNLALSIWQPCR